MAKTENILGGIFLLFIVVIGIAIYILYSYTKDVRYRTDQDTLDIVGLRAEIADIKSKYMPISGGTFTGDVTVRGKLTVKDGITVEPYIEAENIRTNDIFVKNGIITRDFRSVSIDADTILGDTISGDTVGASVAFTGKLIGTVQAP